MTTDDSFNLQRFLEAQRDTYSVALAELRVGKKRSHWMWFIFPQFSGLGTSTMAQRYAIHSKAEAEAYIAHPELGPHLRECAAALLLHKGKNISEIMGFPDDLKLRSSMTLFVTVAEHGSVFHRVLAGFFSGDMDEKTLGFLTDRR